MIDVNVNENQQLKMHIHNKHLHLQACKKLAHRGVKAFDDYMCTSVNVKKCISYVHFMYLLVKVTC